MLRWLREQTSSKYYFIILFLTGIKNIFKMMLVNFIKGDWNLTYYIKLAIRKLVLILYVNLYKSKKWKLLNWNSSDF